MTENTKKQRKPTVAIIAIVIVLLRMPVQGKISAGLLLLFVLFRRPVQVCLVVVLLFHSQKASNLLEASMSFRRLSFVVVMG